jgi:hypothetical protein
MEAMTQDEINAGVQTGKNLRELPSDAAGQDVWKLYSEAIAFIDTMDNKDAKKAFVALIFDLLWDLYHLLSSTDSTESCADTINIYSLILCLYQPEINSRETLCRILY